MAGGGGAWKVAYADFVTAMMAFFMVMWLTSTKPEVKKAIAESFSDPWAKYKINSNTVRKPTLIDPKKGEDQPKKEWMGSHPHNVPHDEPEWPKSNKPKIVTVRASERSTVGAVVQFVSGVDELTPESKIRLKKLSLQLKGLPQLVEVKGHVSTQAASTASDSTEAWTLCFRRSMQVKRFLEGEGVSPERIRTVQAGPYEPITLEPSNNDQDKNARVEVFLLAETAESFKGNKAEKAKSEKVDEAKAQAWLEKNDPASAPAETAKKGH